MNFKDFLVKEAQSLNGIYAGIIVKKVPLKAIENFKIDPNNNLYANKDFNKGDILEEAPYIILDFSQINDFNISDRIFKINENMYALPLGWASFIKTSEKKQNVSWEWDYDRKKIVFFAMKNIKYEQQLFISYLRKFKKNIE